MTSHESQVEQRRIEIYKKMSPADKWREFVKMRQFAWDLKSAAVKEQHPEWSDEQVEVKVREIFLYAST